MIKIKSIAFSILCMVLIFTQAIYAIKPKEISIPCMDKGRSDAQYFRATSSAKSSNQISSKDKSLIITKQLLSSLIGSTIESVSKNYSKNIDATKAASFTQGFENLSREFVNQQLRFVSITCQTSNKGKDGQFETFTAVEMPKEALFEELNKSIMEDNTLKVDYDQAKFKEVFDAEMKKFVE